MGVDLSPEAHSTAEVMCPSFIVPAPRRETSANEYADAVLRLGRAVPQRSLPPCGGGTGRGVASNTERGAFLLAHFANNMKSNVVRVLPLSLSLPHKGGGNRGARTFAPHTRDRSSVPVIGFSPN